MRSMVLSCAKFIFFFACVGCSYNANVRSNKDDSAELNFKRIYVVFYETDQLSKFERRLCDSIRSGLNSVGVTCKATMFKNDALSLSQELNQDDINSFGPDAIIFISHNGGQMLNGNLVQFNLSVSCFPIGKKNAVWKAEVASEFRAFLQLGSLEDSEGLKAITRNLIEQMKKDRLISFL